LLFVHSPPHPTAGRRSERAAVWCSAASDSAEVSERGSAAAMPEQNAEAAGTPTAGRGDASRQVQPNALVRVRKSREKSGMSP